MKLEGLSDDFLDTGEGAEDLGVGMNSSWY